MRRDQPYGAGGGSPARGLSDDSPDEDIAAASSPPPPALSTIQNLAEHGIVQNEEWMSWDERQELVARVRPAPEAQSAATTIRERRINCFLCRFGVLSLDAGPTGTGLYKELRRQMARNLGHMSYEAVVASASDFVQRQMVPFFQRAGVALPPFDYEAVLEHVSTLQHTKNPTLMIIQQITDMDIEIREARNLSRQHGRPADLKSRAENRKDRLALLAFYRAGADMSRLFGFEPLDGELAPDVMQHLAPTVDAMVQDQGETLPRHLEWLVGEEERIVQEASAPAPTMADLDNIDHFDPL